MKKFPIPMRIFAVIMILALATACMSSTPASSESPSSAPDPVSSEGAAASNAEPTAPAGKVNLQLATWFGSQSIERLEIINDVLKSEFPNVSVEIMSWPYEQYMDKLITMHSSGSGPDLFMMEEAKDIYGYVFNDMLEPLDSYYAAGGTDAYDFSMWKPGVKDRLTYDGKLVAVPIYVEESIIWYNPALLEKAGVPMLSDVPTWDEIEAAAKAVYELGNNENGEKIYGIKMHEGSMWTYLAGLNLENLVASDGTVKFNSPERIAAADELVKMNIAYGEPPGLEADQFQQGNVGVMVTTWFGYPAGTAPSLPFETRVTNCPVHNANDKQLVFTDVGAIGMWSGSKNKDMTWQLLALYGGKVGSEQMSDNGVNAFLDEFNEKFITPSDNFPFDGPKIFAIRPDAKTFSHPQEPWTPAMVGAFNAEWRAVSSGTITTQQFFDSVQAAIDEFIAQNA